VQHYTLLIAELLPRISKLRKIRLITGRNYSNNQQNSQLMVKTQHSKAQQRKIAGVESKKNGHQSMSVRDE